MPAVSEQMQASFCEKNTFFAFSQQVTLRKKHLVHQKKHAPLIGQSWHHLRYDFLENQNLTSKKYNIEDILVNLIPSNVWFEGVSLRPRDRSHRYFNQLNKVHTTPISSISSEPNEFFTTNIKAEIHGLVLV